MKPTFTTPSKSFDELLDEFMVIENNRKTAIKIAEEVATGAESNATLNFLKVVREADEVLENIRRYFDAGKVMFDKNKGKSKLNETDLHAKTELLRKETYLNDQLTKLSATYKTIESQVPNLPKDMYRVLGAVIKFIKQSELALILLAKKSQEELEKSKPIST
ncbi:uncharacterized protein [Bemisia tabaci]|uniref:uncharacterized protein isoform X2 n=1 Tax=Bemisia tabaci TaxID=7038 RepID=UPI003B28AA0D